MANFSSPAKIEGKVERVRNSRTAGAAYAYGLRLTDKFSVAQGRAVKHYVGDRADREKAATGDRPRGADGGGSEAEGKAAHRTEPAVDQTEQRHDPAAIGFVGVQLQQGCGEGQESRLKRAGDKQKNQRRRKIARPGKKCDRRAEAGGEAEQ